MDYQRNLKTLNNKTGIKIKKYVSNIIDEHEGRYHWRSSVSSGQRGAQKFTNTLSFFLDGKKYEVIQEIYVHTNIKIDGVKKNITALKKLL